MYGPPTIWNFPTRIQRQTLKTFFCTPNVKFCSKKKRLLMLTQFLPWNYMIMREKAMDETASWKLVVSAHRNQIENSVHGLGFGRIWEARKKLNKEGRGGRDNVGVDPNSHGKRIVIVMRSYGVGEWMCVLIGEREGKSKEVKMTTSKSTWRSLHPVVQIGISMMPMCHVQNHLLPITQPRKNIQ